ncbi:MAG TPA: NADH-quinone oxidoreductase subunit C [Candidatus Omnitrophica bacterium]|nr:MAG: NADH-quinone oxidoreductase subunit C [Candidatus Omnitrophota bacterium]RKY35729.1 MAG: NADH-quinone oxidoreductase subunit C [Candidatus Omnitrophota bacterium]RKY44580.1 MAG: NADH-quinone oxidoreductase subunit C [Candidatus Omnitrophota bacterium]HEC69980.1 NADH-quinone oxidoreductase subunit C [Candidatus Omnitrophota bacterium]
MIKEEVKKKLEGKIKEWFEKNPRRIYITIDKKDLKEVAKILHKDLGMRLSTVTGIDNEKNFELIYHFGKDQTGELFNLRVFIEDKANPEIDSLVSLFNSTEWIEREIKEMLGVNFKGHPDLRHLLLDKDWPEEEYPLRKDYPLKKGYPQDE